MNNLRVPPHSLEAEQSVIGAMLVDGNTQRVREVMDFLSPEMFYVLSNQRYYRAILAVKTIDLITVSESLEDADNDDFANLGMMARNLPSAANIKTYAEIIKDRWIKRELIGLACELSEMGYQGEENDNLVRHATKKLSSMDMSTGYEPKYLIDSMAGFIDRMEARQKQDERIVGIKTGIQGLDIAIGGFRPDWLITLAGRPSMGKTLISQLIAGGIGANKPIKYYSMEMSDGDLTDRFMSILAGVSPKSMKSGLLDDYEASRVSQVIGQMKSGQYKVMFDETPALSHQQIATRSRAAQKKEPSLGLIVIDYLGLMTLPKADRHDLQIAEVTRSLKMLAKELQVPILLLAQANRGADQSSRPNNANLYGSSAIEADSDLVMFVHREEVKNPHTAFAGVTELIPTKYRHGTFTQSVYIARDSNGDEYNQPNWKYITLTDAQVAMRQQQDDSKEAIAPRSFANRHK